MTNKSNLIFFVFFFILLLNFSFVFSATSEFGEIIDKGEYIISRDRIERTIGLGELFRDFIEIENIGQRRLDLNFFVDGDLEEVLELENLTLSIAPGSKESVYFVLKGVSEKNYEGNFKIEGSITEILDGNITISDALNNAPFILESKSVKESFFLGGELFFNIGIKKISKGNLGVVSFNYTLIDLNGDTYELGKETKNINGSFQIVKNFPVPEGLGEGEYVFEISVFSENYSVEDQTIFELKKSFLDIVLFGFLPMWVLIIILSTLLFGILVFYIIKKRIESRKKYKMSLDLKTLPKKNDEFLFLGKVAETKHPVYLDPGRLTTHAIVAGATGGGKSIAAQVIIEEALRKNVAVIVFDPTAQWSGMLRKCADKKMFAYYPKFGMKPKDAQAFKGNVRMVQDARQIIDVSKHTRPGQIQIFSLNKLDPKDMDLFVANVIRQVFKSDPQEFPNLKTLIVFDEVHRLLPKFGGSGEGFLQIERACREFRKWGLGVMLISQVLNDFVGEIKANISTEVQMRTRDEGDLNRIKTKYGETFLQSLVKASVGVGMFANPAYNHARPYFVNFRPILHSTRRLADDELEKYNVANDKVDDLEDSVLQLEKEGIDIFDLNMELKLIKDKIMSGSFSVVDIYLEGLEPRVKKEWEKLGKKPKKREIQLASEEEIKASIEEAKKERAKIEATEKTEKKEAETEAKAKEKLEDKQISPITFDNGAMIGSVKELKDYLPGMDAEIFKLHVNSEKNQIADWVIKNLSKQEGEKLKPARTKSEMIAALENFEKKEEKETDSKKESPKKDKEEKNEGEEAKDKTVEKKGASE